MKEGVSQGCPLSPLFASFVVARLLEPIDSLLRKRAAARLASGDPGDEGFGGISHLLGYVEEISSCVYLSDLPFQCNTLKNIGALSTHQKHAFSPHATTLPLSLSSTQPTPP